MHHEKVVHHLSITVLTTGMASFADPPFDRGHGPKGPKGGGPRGEWNDRGARIWT